MTRTIDFELSLFKICPRYTTLPYDREQGADFDFLMIRNWDRPGCSLDSALHDDVASMLSHFTKPVTFKDATDFLAGKCP